MGINLRLESSSTLKLVESVIEDDEMCLMLGGRLALITESRLDDICGLG
jgi:hypothetical protein